MLEAERGWMQLVTFYAQFDPAPSLRGPTWALFDDGGHLHLLGGPGLLTPDLGTYRRHGFYF